MPHSYKILVTAVDGQGHVNAALGFGELLAANGHEITFTQLAKYQHLATSRGFKFIPFDETILQSFSFTKNLGKLLNLYQKDPFTRNAELSEDDKKANMAFFRPIQERVHKALDKVLQENPDFDLILSDLVATDSYETITKIPFVPIISGNPLCLYPSGPPPFAGFSVNSNKSDWEKYRKVYLEGFKYVIKDMNDWLESIGCSEKFDPITFFNKPKYFGFYHYPEALDYTEYEPRRPGWFRVDATIRNPDSNEFLIPETLKNKPGKLIYFSLGTTGSCDLNLMRKCLSVLAKSPHRFIVSKGAQGDQIELADNMWGENYINQIKVLQAVDLVITHGGNNTFVETLYHGKPMIVIPFFYDQLDNAQRVVDKQIGFRVNPWSFDGNMLLDYIERALFDKTIKTRVEQISASLSNTPSSQEAVKMIENLIESTKKVH